MLEQSGLISFGGHVSSRFSEETFLINAYGKSRMEVTPEDLIETHLDGSPVEEGARIPSEVHIHASIYRARKDVNAVAHLHSPQLSASASPENPSSLPYIKGPSLAVVSPFSRTPVLSTPHPEVTGWPIHWRGPG